MKTSETTTLIILATLLVGAIGFKVLATLELLIAVFNKLA